jgi:hypothetical protein
LAGLRIAVITTSFPFSIPFCGEQYLTKILATIFTAKNIHPEINISEDTSAKSSVEVNITIGLGLKIPLLLSLNTVGGIFRWP